MQHSIYQRATVSEVIFSAVHSFTFQTFFTSTQISTFMYTCPFHYVPLSAVDELLISPVTILLSYSTHEKGTKVIILLFEMCSTLFRFSNFPVKLYEKGVEMTTSTSMCTQMAWFFGNIK